MRCYLKGFHNFDIVLSNLKEYKSKCIGAGQITFKYIVLPGINDNSEDYLGLIRIMEDLGIKALSLSRNTKVKYNVDEEKQEQLIKAVSNLVMLCKEKQIEILYSTYTPDEQDRIEALCQSMKANT